MVTEFWQTLHLKNLSDLNNIYNVQDTIILCEIFENRAKKMMKKFRYNPRKCTSASSLSGCIHWYLSKATIVLPTQVIGGFSCVNTRLAFGLSILLTENLQYQLKENWKLIYKIKNEMKNIFEDKRAVTKILKMDENNQYGNAMTKPVLTGSIKRGKKLPTMKEFNLILQGISDENKIGHLFLLTLNLIRKMSRKAAVF